MIMLGLPQKIINMDYCKFQCVPTGLKVLLQSKELVRQRLEGNRSYCEADV